jgi:hypothetical protein
LDVLHNIDNRDKTIYWGDFEGHKTVARFKKNSTP